MLCLAVMPHALMGHPFSGAMNVLPSLRGQTRYETGIVLSAIAMPLTATEANEPLDNDRKEQGKHSRYEKSIPFRQPLPSGQWKPDEWFHPSVQKTNFWFDRMPLAPH